ncbi:hypothetical protein, partial [Enterococcus faecalis]|uniref:hypothetical protein n=1 Tax=Enterococcus faecalis TaxID=1351 RepID=UPI003D6B8051
VGIASPPFGAFRKLSAQEEILGEAISPSETRQTPSKNLTHPAGIQHTMGTKQLLQALRGFP